VGLTHSSDSQREREQGEKNQGVSNETMVVGDSRLYPTAEEIKDVRTKLTDREVKRIINRAASRQGKEEWPESVLGPISQEQALRLLNEAVRTRIPASGRHGLIRCWTLFREKACASGNGIKFSEFQRACRSLALPFPRALSRTIFSQMDREGKGTISCQAFIDVVMSRWGAGMTSINIPGDGETRDNDPGSAKAVAERSRSPATLVTEMAKFSNKKDETQYALGLLRGKIVATLGNGAKSGVMRMWTDFRRRCCATVDGVSLREFQTGLQLYGIYVSEKTQEEMFHSIDTNKSGTIQIFEFIDNLMGRWEANLHSLPGVGAEEEKLIQVAAAQIAKEKLDVVQKAEIKKHAEQVEKQKKHAAKKIRETPIWAKTTAATSTRLSEQAASRSTAAASLRSTQSEKLLRPLVRPASSVERIHYLGDTPAPSWSMEGQKEKERRREKQNQQARKQRQQRQQRQQQQLQENATTQETTGSRAGISGNWEPPWWDQTERQRQLMEEQQKAKQQKAARQRIASGGQTSMAKEGERRPSTSHRRPRSASGNRSGRSTPVGAQYEGEEFDLMRAIL
jgi:Ca2+-binding EF-hand superfamily protein